MDAPLFRFLVPPPLDVTAYAAAFNSLMALPCDAFSQCWLNSLQCRCSSWLGTLHALLSTVTVLVSFREWTARRPPKIAASLDPFLKPPRSTVSPSMSLLQGYYGLTPTPKGNLTNEGTEMATYAKGKSSWYHLLGLRFLLYCLLVHWISELRTLDDHLQVIIGKLEAYQATSLLKMEMALGRWTMLRSP
jgi:hypothetical protein